MTQGLRTKPSWLEPVWDRKKSETADRVRAAVAKLCDGGHAVTVANICATVKALYGVSISSSTIKRNELAHEIYSRHCGPRASSILPDAKLKQISDGIPDDQKRGFWSKVGRLRRESKDRLIARLIEAEEAIREHRSIESTLRDEVFQLGLREMTGDNRG